MLIDTHAHLNDERLLPIAADIVSTMQAKGLESIINVGYDRESSEKAVSLAHAYDPLYAVVGVHPHDAKSATKDDYLYFEKVSTDPKVVAIGEIGLDFYYDLSDRDVQKKVFVEQLELAHSLKLPVVMHVREAYGLALEILKENARFLEYGGVMHCYAGSKELLRDFVDLGLHASFGGVITFKNFAKQEVVKSCPADRLLLETDCPYMTPVPFRGKTNMPEYVALVRDKIQEWRPDLDVESITTQNAKRLFKI
ncbi:MAG: TatD family hydrolase [Clostridia bacterium]|nr:TatD family hydrolase [Clostridia bacterium]